VLLAPQRLDILPGVEAASRASAAPLHTIWRTDAARLRNVEMDASTDVPEESTSDKDSKSGREVSPAEPRAGVLWENAATAFRAAQIVLSQVSPSIELPAVPFPPAEALPPGRMQRLSASEARSLGLPGKTIILDGAHTPESFHELCAAFRERMGDQVPPKVLFVVAMSNDKDHRKCLGELRGADLNLQTLVFTEVPVAGSFERATRAEALSECWAEIAEGHSTGEAVCEPVFGAALRRVAAAPDDVTVCLAGSMHLVGAALARIAGLDRAISEGTKPS
ncbi:hypothetical protein KFL_000330010, partial [Klebsormidium nitens]